MLQTISMLDLRKQPGRVVDQTLYQGRQWLIKRKNQSVATVIPVADYREYQQLKRQQSIKKIRGSAINAIEGPFDNPTEVRKKIRPTPPKTWGAFLNLTSGFKGPKTNIYKEKHQILGSARDGRSI